MLIVFYKTPIFFKSQTYNFHFCIDALSLTGTAVFTDISGFKVSGPFFDMKDVEHYKKQLEVDVSIDDEFKVKSKKLIN